MTDKPARWSAELGAGFRDEALAAAYPYRPPYPADAIEVLSGLARQGPVLDLGCGTGDLARRLAPLVERVDAVDLSAAMLARGRRLPGGDHPRLRWCEAPAETAPLDPPYALATAGESLHWMDWPAVLGRVAAALVPEGVVAIVERDWDGPPTLRERLRPVFARYSVIRDFQPRELVTELVRCGLFGLLGERSCGPEPWRPTVEEYLECRHSQRGFSRTHLPPADLAAFDAAVRATLDDVEGTGAIGRTGDRLELAVEARVVWGRPHSA